MQPTERSAATRLDTAITALRMIRDNEHGEAWSAGVAMSALASMSDPDPMRCAFVTAAGVRCARDRGHAGAHDTVYVFGEMT